jgi:hypothetical protein
VDQRERVNDSPETFRAALEYWQTRIWTALPCVVHAYPAASGLGPQLLDAQPTINGSYLNSDGDRVSLVMPLLTDCVIVWQGGGGVTATFPIAPEDECLVVLSSRCIDAWWSQGFLKPIAGKANSAMDPPDARMHNLSDGFALVGLRSSPRSFGPNVRDACLITDDQQTFIRLSAIDKAVVIQANGGITLQTTGSITLSAGGEISANGVTIDPNGNTVSPATVTGNVDVMAATVSLKNHLQSGVQSGGGNSGPPVPGT